MLFASADGAWDKRSWDTFGSAEVKLWQTPNNTKVQHNIQYVTVRHQGPTPPTTSSEPIGTVQPQPSRHY